MSTLDRSPSERLGQLYDSHQGRLYRLALRLSGEPEEARDLVQESFFRAARRPAALPAGEPGAEAWLVRTLVNLCRDRYRRLEVRRRAAETVLAEPGEEAGDPESPLVARAAVRAALAELPPRRRAAVVLHELEELPVKDVARLLGISRVTVRWHLSAARKDLAVALAPLASRPLDSDAISPETKS